MKKPNVLFILADDLGWKDTSCYGSPFYETPHIDRLCESGMHFTDAYASCPVCSPTRASILTGRYPATVGITCQIDGSGNNHPKVGKVTDVPYFKELPLTEKCIAWSLKDFGYDCWHVGKWHLGGRNASPLRHGFDKCVGGANCGKPKNYFSPWDFGNYEDAEVPDGTYLDDYLTDQAIELIKNKESETPFYLNMWYHLVHTPLEADKDLIEKYEQKRKSLGLDKVKEYEDGEFFTMEGKRDQRIMRRLVQSHPVYAAMVEMLDNNVGRLVQTLKESGEWENTIIIFYSDNGGLATNKRSPTTNFPLSEGKGWMYEGGVREPLIITWPGKIKEGTVSNHLITSPDFYPTILDMIGAEQEPENHSDGESFYNILRDKAQEPRGPMFWHFPHYANHGGNPGVQCAMENISCSIFLKMTASNFTTWKKISEKKIILRTKKLKSVTAYMLNLISGENLSVLKYRSKPDFN